jgi:hypothetical protein
MTLVCNVRTCKRSDLITVPENQELGLEDDYLCPSCLLALVLLMENRAAYLRQLLPKTEVKT